jgi:hypothetical protein
MAPRGSNKHSLFGRRRAEAVKKLAGSEVRSQAHRSATRPIGSGRASRAAIRRLLTARP